MGEGLTKFLIHFRLLGEEKAKNFQNVQDRRQVLFVLDAKALYSWYLSKKREPRQISSIKSRIDVFGLLFLSKNWDFHSFFYQMYRSLFVFFRDDECFFQTEISINQLMQSTLFNSLIIDSLFISFAKELLCVFFQLLCL